MSHRHGGGRPVTVPSAARAPLSDCLRKTQFASKSRAKQAARRRKGPTDVYECPHPNHDGFVTESGTHWHYAQRRRRPPSTPV